MPKVKTHFWHAPCPLKYLPLPYPTGVVKGGKDVVMFLSHSGDTEECVRAAYHLGTMGVCTIVMTGGGGG